MNDAYLGNCHQAHTYTHTSILLSYYNEMQRQKKAAEYFKPSKLLRNKVTLALPTNEGGMIITLDLNESIKIFYKQIKLQFYVDNM